MNAEIKKKQAFQKCRPREGIAKTVAWFYCAAL
jgi:hypothetical protein